MYTLFYRMHMEEVNRLIQFFVIGQGDCCCKEDISKRQSRREWAEEWNRRKKKEEAEMKKREEEIEGLRSTGSKKDQRIIEQNR